MNIYQLTQEAHEINAMVEAHYADGDGEFDEAFEEYVERWFTEHEASAEDKLHGYGIVVRQSQDRVKVIDDEIARLNALKAPELAKQQTLKDAVMGYLVASGQTKVQTPLFTFSRVKSGGKQKLYVDPEITPDDVPERYHAVKVSINNDAIREAIAEGMELPFARLLPRGEHLRMK